VTFVYTEEVRDGLYDPLATNFKSATADWKTGANFRVRRLLSDEYKKCTMKQFTLFSLFCLSGICISGSQLVHFSICSTQIIAEKCH